jgi:hypothetical protein
MGQLQAFSKPHSKTIAPATLSFSQSFRLTTLVVTNTKVKGLGMVHSGETQAMEGWLMYATL